MFFKMNRSFAAALVLTLLAISSAQAGELRLLAAGGYKKSMQAVLAAYQKQTGQQAEAGYGNMRQILSQAKLTGQAALVIGDEKFLRQEDIFASFQPIGEGRLVLAWAQGSPAISTPEDLTRPEVGRIAHPDKSKAIFGRAATEWLRSAQLDQKLQAKLIQAATVPQVSSYLAAKEVDAGFISLTDAIGLGGKIGGYLPLPSGYEKIVIVAGTIKGHENDAAAKDFLAFLTGPQARRIFKEHGM
jgi:molybdate transport system substrate-binding protein